MKRSKLAEQAILEWIEQQQANRSKNSIDNDSLDVEQLTLYVQSQQPRVTRKHIQKVLQKLSERGNILKKGERYFLTSSADDEESVDSDAEDEQEDEEEEEENGKKFLTAAEIMRQKLKTKSVAEQSASQKNDPFVDIDEEIRRLEQELAAPSDENESNVDSLLDDEDDDDDDDLVQEGSHVNDEQASRRTNKVLTDAPQATRGTGVLCLSEVAAERIEALPTSCLPANRKRVLKAVDSVTESTVGTKRKKAKTEPQSDSQKRQLLANEGLAGTIREVLDGYVARSAERLPFYCRVCAKQYNNEEEFLGHRQTEVHQSAVELDRKASFCKLCRKQFTSPDQMKEHLSSRPHKERLEMVKSKQGKGIGGHPRNPQRPMQHHAQRRHF